MELTRFQRTENLERAIDNGSKLLVRKGGQPPWIAVAIAQSTQCTLDQSLLKKRCMVSKAGMSGEPGMGSGRQGKHPQTIKNGVLQELELTWLLWENSA